MIVVAFESASYSQVRGTLASVKARYNQMATDHTGFLSTQANLVGMPAVFLGEMNIVISIAMVSHIGFEGNGTRSRASSLDGGG